MRRLDLQRIRQERNISQKQVVEMTGYPQGFVSKMERGVVSTSEAFIAKVSEVFNIPDIARYVYEETPTPKQEQVAPKSEDVVSVPEVRQTPKLTGEQSTIQQLFEVISRRDARIDKLEQELDRLRDELMTLKMGKRK